MAVRTLVVDDNAMVRLGLSVFIETIDGFELVGEAGNGEQAIVQCMKLQPDLVLMDMLMPVMDGITATYHIREQFPHIQVVMLSSATDPAQIQAALEAGIAQFIPKTAGNEHLAQALREIAAKSRAPVLELPPRLDGISGQENDANAFAQQNTLLERRAQ